MNLKSDEKLKPTKSVKAQTLQDFFFFDISFPTSPLEFWLFFAHKSVGNSGRKAFSSDHRFHFIYRKTKFSAESSVSPLFQI